MGVIGVGNDNPLNKQTKKKIKNQLFLPAQKKTEVMRVNHFLSNKYVVWILAVFFFFFWSSVFNYLVNFIANLIEWGKSGPLSGVLDAPGSVDWGFANIFPRWDRIFSNGTLGMIYIIAFIALVIWTAIFVYKVRVNFSDDYFNVNQKGDQRWTSLDEIKAQYKAIPCDGSTFSGMPGTVVCSYTEKNGMKNLYIEQGCDNNLIIGMTRSGKGEMYVFNSIDIQSRSEIKPSLVINDPKCELYKSAKNILEERGYEVKFLKLDDPLLSMGYNPLTLIINLWRNGDVANAELLTQSFAYSIFNPDDEPGENRFFAEQAAQLLSALVIAICQDALNEDAIVNQKRKDIYDSKRARFDALPESSPLREKAIETIKILREKEPDVDIISSGRTRYIPPEENFYIVSRYEKTINMYSLYTMFTELATQVIDDKGNTALDNFFAIRPKLDRARLKYTGASVAGDRTKGGIYSMMLSKLTIFTYENIAKMTAESTINLTDIGYGKKPIAVFMSAPDFDKSNHFIATIFVRQLYFVLAKRASNSMSGAVDRPVKFILDEFGNMPSIEGMDSILTVCLGRKISFDMYIQSYQQLKSHYGDNAGTIKENCGNQIYILTNDKDTSEEFSGLLGPETKTDITRQGERHSLKKTISESTIEKPLLSPVQLRALLPGECVIVRAMKRTDLNGESVRPTPIFCNQAEGTAFVYRYKDEYLKSVFPDPNTIDLSSINNEDRSHIDLQSRVWDEKISIDHFENNNYPEVFLVESLDANKRASVEELLARAYGNDYKDKFPGAWNKVPLANIFAIVQNDLTVEKALRNAIISIIGKNNATNNIGTH